MARQCADNIIAVESCRRMTLAAKEAACIINTRHSLEAPLRVDSGVLASPAKRVPATQPRAVPRVDAASREQRIAITAARRSPEETL